MKSRITTSILGFLFLDSVRAAGGSVLPSDLVTPPCPPELRAEDPGTGESGPGRSEQPSIPALTPSGPERGVTGQASSCELGSSSLQPRVGTWQAHHQLIHSFIHGEPIRVLTFCLLTGTGMDIGATCVFERDRVPLDELAV